MAISRKFTYPICRLKGGRWIELPKDKFVYVICWSGIRGKSSRISERKIIFLFERANGWVEFGGKWIGEKSNSRKNIQIKISNRFSTDDVKKKVAEGVILVDTREPYKFNQSHIEGSVNIPIMYTPTINLERHLAKFQRIARLLQFVTDTLIVLMQLRVLSWNDVATNFRQI